MLTVAKNKQLLSLSDGYLRKQRKQIVWHAQRVLSHDSARVGSSRVEVSQQRGIPLIAAGLALLLGISALSLDVVSDDLLDLNLGPSVCTFATDWAVLGNGDHVRVSCSITVNRGRR